MQNDFQKKDSVNGRKVYRPAVLPDNKKFVFYPLVVCGLIAAAGGIAGNLVMAVLPLIFLAVFPGLPVFFHTILFLSVKIIAEGNMITVINWAGNPYLRIPRRQDISLPEVAYIYYLEKEAEGHRSDGMPEHPFVHTCLKKNKYFRANRDPRCVGAVARVNRTLVLADLDAEKKLYLTNVHDLSSAKRKQLVERIQKTNPDIDFLMDDKEVKSLTKG